MNKKRLDKSLFSLYNNIERKRKAEIKMKNWFCTIISGEYDGEQFFVQCEKREEAIEKATEIAEGEKIFVGKISWTDEEAEASGLDTY